MTPASLQRQTAVWDLLAALEVEPRKTTKLVDVTVQGNDPNQVVRQVNAVATAYVQQNLDKRLQASRSASVWLRKEGESLPRQNSEEGTPDSCLERGQTPCWEQY